jgi:esterase FrsA
MKVIVPAVALSVLAAAAFAQAPRERTIEEIKIEAQARAERGGYPMIGLDPSDVREALSNIKTRDRVVGAFNFPQNIVVE